VRQGELSYNHTRYAAFGAAVLLRAGSECSRSATGIVCDTQKQMERFCRASFSRRPRKIGRESRPNAEENDPNACVVGTIAVSCGGPEIATAQDSKTRRSKSFGSSVCRHIHRSRLPGPRFPCGVPFQRKKSRGARPHRPRRSTSSRLPTKSMGEGRHDQALRKNESRCWRVVAGPPGLLSDRAPSDPKRSKILFDPYRPELHYMAPARAQSGTPSTDPDRALRWRSIEITGWAKNCLATGMMIARKLRNLAHASTPRSSRVGKIARRRATMDGKCQAIFSHPYGVSPDMISNFGNAVLANMVWRSDCRRIVWISKPRKRKVAALTAPRNVVLVGASDRAGSWGGAGLAQSQSLPVSRPDPSHQSATETRSGTGPAIRISSPLPEAPDQPGGAGGRRPASRRRCGAGQRAGAPQRHGVFGGLRRSLRP